MDAHPITIDRVRLDWGRMPVRVSFSYGQVDAFPFFVVRLRSGDHEGVGDSVVEPTERLREVLQALPGTDARRLDHLLPATREPVCEAVSIALHDLVGKVVGLPLHTLLGGAGTFEVPLMPCLFPEDADAAASEARRWIDRGYRALKVKFKGDLDSDRKKLKAIRSIAPEEVVVQGDANEGYLTLDDAARAVRELGAAGLDVFEDPLRGDPSDYAELRRRSKGRRAKIMVDLLARKTGDLIEVLRRDAADLVGIHPVQPGTLTRAVQHTRLAQSFGVPAVIGGTGYTGISTAAYQHLAAVVTPGGTCGEIGGSFDHGMPRSLAAESPTLKDGAITLPDRPGHGVTLDPAALDEFATGSAAWETRSNRHIPHHLEKTGRAACERSG